MLDVQFHITHLCGETTVEVTGELDVSNAHEFFAAIIDAHKPHHQGVTIDLAGVTFMDSRGLMTLVRAQRNLAGRGTSLRVANPRVGVAKALEVTGVAAYLDQAHAPTSTVPVSMPSQ